MVGDVEETHRRLRDRALFDLAIDSKLRGCDIVKMKIGDIVAGGAIRNRATVMQQKTKRPVQFELMTEARRTLLTWLNRRGGTVDDFIFPSRVNYMGHLSTRQYARLVDEWVSAVGLNVSEYGTHSLRRTKASLIYKATGNLRAIQILLGHSNIENTVRDICCETIRLTQTNPSILASLLNNLGDFKFPPARADVDHDFVTRRNRAKHFGFRDEAHFHARPF